MADRRMFTKKITDDDRFVSLPSSAQALYLHLSMSADDDGFCNQVSASMFKAHATTADLEMLLERKYLYQFADGVIVIKHWRMANALRKDRYTKTAFQDDLAKLHLEENGAYTLTEDDGCRLVAERLPQDSIGKDSIDKNNICGAPKEHKEKPIRNQVPPTVEMVKGYCESRHNGIDPQYFCDFYETRGWKLSNGKKMVDWQASVRTWEKNNGGTNRNNQEVRGTSTRVSDEKRQAVEEWEARQRALFSGQ